MALIPSMPSSGMMSSAPSSMGSMMAGAQSPLKQFPGALSTAGSAKSGRLKVGVGKDLGSKKMKMLKSKLSKVAKAKPSKKMI